MSDEPDLEPVAAGRPGAGMPQGEGEPGDGGEGDMAGSGAGSPGGSGGPQGRSATASGGQPTGTGSPAGTSGGMTPAEQVAVLDAELRRGTGDFDAMILEEQARQRDSARASTGAGASDYEEPVDSGGGYGAPAPEPGGGMARNGSSGGGIGGVGGASPMPKDTAKYPPPDDIPSGDDDDVVARQLREAAMREPDPAVREKLWEEYRKYKGISK